MQGSVEAERLAGAGDLLDAGVFRDEKEGRVAAHL